MILTNLLLLAAAGAAGTLARYGLSTWVQRAAAAPFPWGTFAVNIVGSFAFGVVWSLAAERAILRPQVQLVLLTGFMGAFTTFSTFMFESGELIRGGEYGKAFLNVAGQSVIGLVALFSGFAAGRIF